MSATKSDFFEDIAVAMDSWVEATSGALSKPNADLVWVEDEAPYRNIQQMLAGNRAADDDLKQVLAECLRGFAVSILTALDGGTALAEKGRLYLVDADGHKLGEGLHGDFVNHLLDTGRLRS